VRFRVRFGFNGGVFVRVCVFLFCCIGCHKRSLPTYSPEIFYVQKNDSDQELRAPPGVPEVPLILQKHWLFAVRMAHSNRFFGQKKATLAVPLSHFSAPSDHFILAHRGLHSQFATLKRAVLTAILPVFSVAEMVILTASSVSSIAVPPLNANDTPLFAEMVRMPCFVGTEVSTLMTEIDPIVNAESAAHVAVALTMVSADVSIGPKSA
jgi:hypothetical protein